MKKHFISILFLLFFTIGASAQYVNLSAELRPRLENRQGYKSLLGEDQEAASFVSQRTRLNVAFTQDNLRMGLSLQNVRVWGDVSTLAASDKATAFHEAWAEAILSPVLSLKFGRQEIVYDDSRIFGNVGWAQQGRSHDAMLAKFTLDSNRTLHMGFAMNADAQTNTKVAYSNAAGYKNFQYAWYHHKLGGLGMSLLFLNNGASYDNDGQQAVDYSQTVGGRLHYKIGKITTDFSSYYQGGQLAGNTMNARYFAGNLTFRPRAGVSLKLGTEYLSGKDMNDTSSKVKSFVPLYGTNHKFNGWMDYFYVGNHGGSVGLLDVYGTLAFKTGKFSASMTPHFFSSAADVYRGTEKLESRLGTELDFSLGYKLSKDIQCNAGYSRMYATDSMEVLQGGDKDSGNQWAWLMITFKPTLFSNN